MLDESKRRLRCSGRRRRNRCWISISSEKISIRFVRHSPTAISPADALDKFVELDSERRRVIGEADAVNQARNAASKEIGALMQAGKRDEAEAKKAEVAGLKDKQAELEKARDEVDAAMRDLLSGLPNIPADDVPVGADESANDEDPSVGRPA